MRERLAGLWMKVPGRVVVGGLAIALACVLPLHPQEAGPAGLSTTTREHMESESWWPTDSTSPLQAYAGSEACGGCHAVESSAHPMTGMQRAALPVTDAGFMKDRGVQTFASKPFTYAMTASATGIEYTVANGGHKLTHKLDWVIGAGGLGRTFLYNADGRWYQSELTFYSREGKLDVTTGLSDPSSSLEQALGQALSPADARTCFGCHTVHATTSGGFNPLHAEAGLGCEACHGPGLEHAKTMAAKGGGVGGGAVSAVFNPAKLSPSDSIDFCGACHRTFADTTVTTAGSVSTAIVRFQPYRLEESKCWRATQDERLTCVACHNPHQPLNRDVASYDRHCLQCHATVAGAAPAEHAGKACPKAVSQCVSCHMPKVAIASMHGDFTDHFIRVVRPEDGFPR